MFRTYDVHCPECDSYAQILSDVPVSIGDRAATCVCGAGMDRCIRRLSTVKTHPRTRFQQHHNNSTGTVVNNIREFRDDLKRKAEDQWNLTGIEHDYQPIDSDGLGAVGDPAAVGASHDGLDAQEKRHRELGWIEPERKYL